MSGKHQHAVLPALDHQGARPHGEDFLGRTDQVGLVRELAGLPLVDQQQVDMHQGAQQRFALAGNPEVHGVAGHQLRCPDLAENLQLQFGVDVAQENVLGFPVSLGKPRVKRLEDVQVRRQRLGLVQIVVVASLPAERLAGRLLQPLKVNIAGAQKVEVRLRKVFADHRDQPDGREETGRRGKVGSGTSEGFGGMAEGGRHRVEGHRPHHQNAHPSPPVATWKSRVILAGA